MYLQPATVLRHSSSIIITKIGLYKDNGCFIKWIDTDSEILLDLLESQKIKISNDVDFLINNQNNNERN